MNYVLNLIFFQRMYEGLRAPQFHVSIGGKTYSCEYIDDEILYYLD